MKTADAERTALVIAAEDAATDSGAYAVDDYLRIHFLPGELEELGAAAAVLAERCEVIHAERMKRKQAANERSVPNGSDNDEADPDLR